MAGGNNGRNIKGSKVRQEKTYTLIQLLEFQSRKSRAHALHLEEYFKFEGVRCQPLECLNHVELGKSENSSCYNEGTVEVDHKIHLENPYEVHIVDIYSTSITCIRKHTHINTFVTCR